MAVDGAVEIERHESRTVYRDVVYGWIDLVNRHGGLHHGYFLPAEGASDVALALFSFPSLADYETYRSRFGADPEFVGVPIA
jgi:hypothetical protein